MIRALLHLSLATCRRFAREPRVVRSVVWPLFLTPLTLAITLLVLTTTSSPDRTVAIPPDAPDGLRGALTEAGFTPREVAEPALAIDRGEVTLATDGATVWTSATRDVTLALEQVVRQERGSGWILAWERRLPDESVLREFGSMTLRPLTMLFVLYALVFSLGTIARDRDAEILDVELSLPLPAWGPVLARWVASFAVLGVAYGLALALLQLVLPAADPVQFLLRGLGAIGAAAGVGVAVAGGAGRSRGFSGPFAVGSILVAGAFTAGPLVPWARDGLPLFTLLTDAPGLSSFLLGVAAGPIGAWLHAWRERGTA